MRIAIDLRAPEMSGINPPQRYPLPLLKALIYRQSTNEFLILANSVYAAKNLSEKNIKVLVSKPGILSGGWIERTKIAGALKENKVDVFLACANNLYPALSIPQVWVISDLAFLHNPNDYTKKEARRIGSKFEKNVSLAKRIIVPSAAMRDELLEKFEGRVQASNVAVVPPAPGELFQPLPWYEREYTKDKYAGGKDYFVFKGPVHPGRNLFTLLKAFAQFKKWQQTNMKLVILGEWSDNSSDLALQMESFRFKDDVAILENESLEDEAKIIGAAYALVDPSIYAPFGQSLLEPMKAETPVLCSNLPAFREAAADAAGYFDAERIESLSDEMKHIYKDETWRADLIEKGKLRCREWEPDAMADLFWQQIIEAVNV